MSDLSGHTHKHGRSPTKVHRPCPVPARARSGAQPRGAHDHDDRQPVDPGRIRPADELQRQRARGQPFTKDISSSPLTTAPLVVTWDFTGPTPGASQVRISMLTVIPAIDSDAVLSTIVA